MYRYNFSLQRKIKKKTQENVYASSNNNTYNWTVYVNLLWKDNSISHFSHEMKDCAVSDTTCTVKVKRTKWTKMSFQ